MRNKRRKILSSRRKFEPVKRNSEPPAADRPDILDIWDQQKLMREREAQLEREYDAAKQNLRDVKRRMRHNDSLLADNALLHTSLRESLSQSAKGFWLWFGKTLRKIELKTEIFYIRTRLRLGFPLRGRSNFTREKVVLASVLVASVGALILLPANKKLANDPTAVQGSSQTSASEIPLNQTPEFPVLSPAGNGVSNLGGYAKVSPPGSPATYAFLDNLENVGIKVSQQELPDKLKDKSELQKMASDFNANRQLKTDQGTVYIGQSAKGPQSLVLAIDGLLVLISSDGEISDAAWKAYISNLKV